MAHPRRHRHRAARGWCPRSQGLRRLPPRPGAARPVTDRPTAADLLDTPGALLTRTHLRELGLGRSAIDAVFRALAVVQFPGSSRPAVKVEDYLGLVERSTFRDDRVRPRG